MLKIAASVKFINDHARKPIIILSLYVNMILHASSKKVHVDCWNYFRFIRCFGTKIIILTLYYVDEHVNSYINRYCAEISLELVYRAKQKAPFSLKTFSKPFNRVEKLQVNFANPASILNIAKLKYCFPNIGHLVITPCCIKPHSAYSNIISTIDTFDDQKYALHIY